MGEHIMPHDVCGHRQDDVEIIVLLKENVRVQNINKQKAKAFVYTLIENACRNLCGRKLSRHNSGLEFRDRVVCIQTFVKKRIN